MRPFTRAAFANTKVSFAVPPVRFSARVKPKVPLTSPAFVPARCHVFVAFAPMSASIAVPPANAALPVDGHRGRVCRVVERVVAALPRDLAADTLAIAERERVGAAAAGEILDGAERERVVDIARVQARDVPRVRRVRANQRVARA